MCITYRINVPASQFVSLFKSPSILTLREFSHVPEIVILDWLLKIELLKGAVIVTAEILFVPGEEIGEEILSLQPTIMENKEIQNIHLKNCLT